MAKKTIKTETEFQAALSAGYEVRFSSRDGFYLVSVSGPTLKIGAALLDSARTLYSNVQDFEFLKDVATGYIKAGTRLGKDAFVQQCTDHATASRAYDAALAALPVAKVTPEFSPEDDRPWVYSDNNTFRTLPPTRKQDQGAWFLITECEELVAGRWEGFVAVAPIRNKGAK